MKGTYLPILIRVIPGVVWNGIESWWGAQAVSTCIGTWSLKWANWSHPLAGGNMELKDFIGYIIYNVICEYGIVREVVMRRFNTQYRYVHHLDATRKAQVAVLSLVRGLHHDSLRCVERNQ